MSLIADAWLAERGADTATLAYAFDTQFVEKNGWPVVSGKS